MEPLTSPNDNSIHTKNKNKPNKKPFMISFKPIYADSKITYKLVLFKSILEKSTNMSIPRAVSPLATVTVSGIPDPGSVS